MSFEAYTAHSHCMKIYVACDQGGYGLFGGMGLVVISRDLASLFIIKGRKRVVAALNLKGHFFGSDLC